MKFDNPRIITDKTFKRYITYTWKHNKQFICHKCGRSFKIGEKLFKINSKYYCEQCYLNMWIDIPDSILDKEDIHYIEKGFYPSTITTYATINTHNI